MITQKQLKKILNYNQKTGEFIWNIACKGHFAFSKAGTIHIKGYIRIRITGKSYLAHRLAWLYVYGKWPIGVIDHIDHNKQNNRIKNLRDTSYAVNQHNQNKAQSNNKLGIRGVILHKPSGTYLARITNAGKTKYIGYFLSKDLAYRAYLKEKLNFINSIH